MSWGTKGNIQIEQQGFPSRLAEELILRTANLKDSKSNTSRAQ